MGNFYEKHIDNIPKKVYNLNIERRTVRNYKAQGAERRNGRLGKKKLKCYTKVVTGVANGI